jgi:hypothetical protein
MASVRFPAKPVPRRQLTPCADPLEKRRLSNSLELDGGAHESRALSVRQQCTHDHVPIVDRVDTEHLARIVQPAGQQPADVVIVQVSLQYSTP